MGIPVFLNETLLTQENGGLSIERVVWFCCNYSWKIFVPHRKYCKNV